MIIIQPQTKHFFSTVADLWGERLARALLLPKIFSISCSSSQNFAKSYVGAPPGGLVPPPTWNPGSAPDQFECISGMLKMQIARNIYHVTYKLLSNVKSSNVYHKFHNKNWKYPGKIWLLTKVHCERTFGPF